MPSLWSCIIALLSVVHDLDPYPQSTRTSTSAVSAARARRIHLVVCTSIGTCVRRSRSNPCLRTAPTTSRFHHPYAAMGVYSIPAYVRGFVSEYYINCDNIDTQCGSFSGGGCHQLPNNTLLFGIPILAILVQRSCCMKLYHSQAQIVANMR